jgi:hypothetical protein
MRKLVLTAAAAIVATSVAALAAPSSARAADAPVCAMISGDAEATYCNFVSFQQCQAFIAGQSGTCSENFRHWTGAQARYMGPVVMGPVMETFAFVPYQGPAIRIDDGYNHRP